MTLPFPRAWQAYASPSWQQTIGGYSGAEVWATSDLVLKTQPLRTAPITSLAAEAERLRYFAPLLPVPEVLDLTTDNEREYLLMTRVEGVDLSDAERRGPDAEVIALLAAFLRRLHSLPVEGCPFDARLSVRLAQAATRVAAGQIDPNDLDEVRAPSDILRELQETRPPREDLVVTHGDACLPNFLALDGQITGMIDVGRAGVADRHTDLALAWRSTRRNLNAAAAEALLDAYGRQEVQPDKLRYYCLLDELF